MPNDPGLYADYVERNIHRNTMRQQLERSLGPHEVARRRDAERQLRRRVSPFVLNEAIESRDEISPLRAERGFYSLRRGLLPRDSNGDPYLVHPERCKRLFRIISDEWWDLSAKQQSFVSRRSKDYYMIMRNE